MTNQSTYDSLNTWVASLNENIPRHFNTILIGNKIDLGGDREIGMEKGANFAEA